jgi:hypothetical protein
MSELAVLLLWLLLLWDCKVRVKEASDPGWGKVGAAVKVEEQLTVPAGDCRQPVSALSEDSAGAEHAGSGVLVASPATVEACTPVTLKDWACLQPEVATGPEAAVAGAGVAVTGVQYAVQSGTAPSSSAARSQSAALPASATA